MIIYFMPQFNIFFDKKQYIIAMCGKCFYNKPVIKEFG